MTLQDEAKDPWGWLLAGITGGLTWAALGSAAGPIGVVAGVVVGATVFGTKVVVGAVVNRDEPRALTRSAPDSLPSPPPNSPAAVYLGRAARARRQMSDIAKRPGDQWLREEVGRMDDGADEVVDSMRGLAGRVTLAEQILFDADGPALAADRSVIAAQLAQTTDPMLGQEQRRALAAVDEQLASLTRLSGVRDQLLARMHTAAVGMETVATRMGEVVTMGTAALEHDRAGDVIADASNDLEALRTGLAEAQQLARGVVPAPPPGD